MNSILSYLKAIGKLFYYKRKEFIYTLYRLVVKEDIEIETSSTSTLLNKTQNQSRKLFRYSLRPVIVLQLEELVMGERIIAASNTGIIDNRSI